MDLPGATARRSTIASRTAAHAIRALDGGRLILPLLVASVVGFAVDAAAQAGHAGDRAALMALYEATNGPDWSHSNNWNTNAAIGTWEGVTTDSDGRVIHLFLRATRLAGPIPAELGNLTRLTALDLRQNGLTGPIPPELARLTSLTQLVLFSNQLTGPIPMELSNLTGLTTLDLGYNGLSGSIPAELGDLTGLTTLDLGGNGLSGSIPAALGNLTNLTRLGLANNGLSGSIPAALGSLASLDTLYLEYNDLSGSIPTELGNLANLTTLRLGNNDLSGSIPAALGNLTSLNSLDLNYNNLSGPVPTGLSGLTEIDSLSFRGNRLTGELDPSFRNAFAFRGESSSFFIDYNAGLCVSANLHDWLVSSVSYLGADICGEAAALPRRPPTVTVTPASIPAGVRVSATFEVVWARAADVPPRDELVFSLSPLVCNSWFVGIAPPRLSQNWHPTSDGLGYSYRNEFWHRPIPAGDIQCILRATEVRGGKGAATLTISSTASVPDLAVREPLAVSDANPAAGQEITLSATVENLGTRAAAGPTMVHYYSSGGDSHLDPDDPVVGTDSVQALDAGAHGDSVVRVAAPLVEGVYFYVACVDQVAGEVYTDNNCAPSDVVRVTGTIAPDLVVVSPTVSRDRVDPGQYFVLSVTVRNQSAASSGEEPLLRFIQSTDARLSLPEGDTLIGSLLRVEILEGGGESRKEVQVRAPSTPGRYYYGACVDWVYGEVNIDNNCSMAVAVVVGDVEDGEDEVDRAALVAFYNATGGPNWSRSANWLSEEPIGRWEGIVANGMGRVSQIRLNDNQLAGQLPAELGNLDHLEVVELGENKLTGPIPGALVNLVALRRFQLPGNELTGPISQGFGNIPGLVNLNLSRNKFTGEIPASLGNLTALELLSLGDNELTGSIPASLGNVRSLRNLWLTRNRLTGEIPDSLGNLVNVGILLLGSNDLTGSIPRSLGNLTSLTILTLHRNRLTGTIPASLARFESSINPQQGGVHLPVEGEGAAGFTDDPIVAGRTVVRAVHFTELRERVDGLRTAHGLGPFAWTDAAIARGVTAIKAVHLLELRGALADAYEAAGRGRPLYTGAVETGVASIRAVHINELRRAVLALE